MEVPKDIKNNICKQFKILFSIIILALFSSFANAQQDRLKLVCENVKNNVVGVRAKFAEGEEERGFGFIIGEKKDTIYLVTAAHVIFGANFDMKAKLIQVKFFNDISWVNVLYVVHWEEDDVALLKVKKPDFVKWNPNCADFLPQNAQKVCFIGLFENEPRWVSPGIGEVFDVLDKHLDFSIGTIRPGTSGAPLIGEKGILGLILKDEGSSSSAIRLSRLQELLNKKNQYSYFNLKGYGELLQISENNNPPYIPTRSIDDQMVLVKGGSFLMTCGNCYGFSDHLVTLNDFSIGKTEVTQGQWRAIMGGNPSVFNNCEECPVENVNWDDIQVFLSKLNEKTGKKYRLPTEAEWEFAARGGNFTKGYTYSGSDNAAKVAWFKSDISLILKTRKVADKLPNELGLYDMSGNVKEWCQDWYGHYGPQAQINPTGPNSSTYGRVVRGGSWDDYRTNVGERNYHSPGTRLSSLGFRLAL